MWRILKEDDSELDDLKSLLFWKTAIYGSLPQRDVDGKSAGDPIRVKWVSAQSAT